MPTRRRLTPDQVREIRTSTESCKILGKRFSVSNKAIWDARNYVTHVDVTDAPPDHRSKMTIEIDRNDKEYFFDQARAAKKPLRAFIASILHEIAVDDRREHMGVVRDG